MTDDTHLTRVDNTLPEQISPYDLLVIAWPICLH